MGVRDKQSIERVILDGIEYTVIDIEGEIGYIAKAIKIVEYKKIGDTYTLIYNIPNNINGIPVTSMEGCFELGTAAMECDKGISIKRVALDLSGSSFINVLNMDSAFSHFQNLTSIKFPIKEDMPKALKIAKRMFLCCGKLKNIDLSGLNTAHLEDASEMFNTCIALESVDIRIDHGNDVNMERMFSWCKHLSNLKLPLVDLSYITNLRGMFESCSRLESVVFKAPSNTEHMNRDARNMFFECTKLTGVDFGYFGKCDLDVSHMLNFCSEPLSLKGLKHIRFIGHNCMGINPPRVASLNIKEVNIQEFIAACNNNVGGLLESCNCTDKLNYYNLEYVKGTHEKYSISQDSIIGDEICLLGVQLINNSKNIVTSLTEIVSYLQLQYSINPKIIVLDESIRLTTVVGDNLEINLMGDCTTYVDLAGMNGEETYEYLLAIINKVRMFGDRAVIVVKNLGGEYWA